MQTNVIKVLNKQKRLIKKRERINLENLDGGKYK